jgi:hypothetical protein
VQTSSLWPGISPASKPRATRRRRRLRGGLAALGVGLLAASAVAIAPGNAGKAGQLARAQAPAALMQHVVVGPPPVLTRAARSGSRTPRAQAPRLIATPSILPASGGAVRVRARVHAARRCVFSTVGLARERASSSDCASGRAAVTLNVPRNTTAQRRAYIVALTISTLRGALRTVRSVIVQQPRTLATGAQQAGHGVTAASGGSAHPVTASGSAPRTAASSASSQPASPAAASVAPVITLQPVSQTVAPGSPVNFTATASGTPTPTLQWQLSSDGGASWSPAAASFLSSAAENGYEYRAVFTNAAGSATTAAATLTVPATTTENFSGYIDYAESAESYTAVSASWVVPTVTCQAGQTSWAAQWPGIGDGGTVQQDGTETDCFNGVPTYWAWYEMYGDDAVNNGYAVALGQQSYPVFPGDQMTGSVTFNGASWQLALSDATQSWSFQTQIAQPSPGLSQGSAEWMVEDPDGCTPQCQTLAQYTPVQFSGASAAAGGHSGSISAFPATLMQMRQGSSLLATVGPLDAAGDSFGDSWLAG